MSDERPAPAPPSAAHVHTGAVCPRCSGVAIVEHEYKIDDRQFQLLLLGLCRSLGLSASRKSRKARSTFVVLARDQAAHDAMWTRFQALVPSLDNTLFETTAAFVHKHCGVKLVDAATA